MRIKSTVFALLAFNSAAFAAEVPSAGSVLQQIPLGRVPDKAVPELRIESGEKPVSAAVDAVRIKVQSLRLIDAHAFAEADLIAVTGFMPGDELSLAQLRVFTVTITDYYRSRGYFLAHAHLPAQDVVDGAVTIAIVEGQYGKVVLRNQSNLADGVAKRLIAGIDTGDAITIAPLERRLLQLADVPGVSVKSTLVPGASVGASDLIIDVTNDRRVSGAIDVDNSGGRYTGAYRTGATVNFNSVLGLGDVATLRALTSWEGLNYGRAAYQLQAGRADVGVAYTALRYELGREFESLKAHGTAEIVSLYARYPLIRSRSNNLYAQLGLDSKVFQDKLDLTPPTVTDKKARVAMTSLIGDYRDDLGGGGSSTYSLTWTSGSLDLQSPAAAQVDALSAHSNGHYDKLGWSVTRLQRLTETLSLYGSLTGQLASQNLDISEKVGLGGAGAVRAYPEGEAYVDQGYVVSVEVRLALPQLFAGMSGDWQLVGFADSGSGRANKDPWSAGRNRRTLSGGGLGLNWFDARSFVVKAYYAHTIGAAEATSAPDRDSRFWINAVKYF
ncbi:ShlB/FhaC/HecB family hemolysin secretion/activation protein [Povalibacter sp.]|uniref:ShlB/FhaC/HecB family hemolysin secretion/activation protein n=1 Tax=Povalibacter sp. TaxID=1962978 RepID=UPI002F427CF9